MSHPLNVELTAANVVEDLNRREVFAQRVGIGVQDVRTVNLEMKLLRQHSILVDLTITGTSMLSRAASWMELGVNEPVTQARFTRGRKSLFGEPEKRIKSIETRMRQNLERFSYSVTGLRPWKAIPWTAWDAWKAEQDRLEEEFRAVKYGTIIDRYDEHVDKLAEDFTQVAHAAWRALQAQEPTTVILGGKEHYDIFSFTDTVIALVLTRMPSPAELEAGLTATYTTAMLASEQDFVADQLAAQRLRDQMTLEQAAADAERKEIYHRANMVELEAHHQNEIQTLERLERRAKLDAIHQAEYDRAMEQLKEIGSPVLEVIQQLRGRIATNAQKMLDSIRKNGFVRGKVAENGAGLLDFFELMAAHNDTELRSLLANLRTEIGPIGDERSKDEPARNVADISTTLEEIIALASASVEDLAEVSRAAFIEL